MNYMSTEQTQTDIIPAVMQAMVLEKAGGRLAASTLAVPKPGPTQVLVKVMACGICRTDLHVIDGELPHPKLPLVPGHEIVGTVVRTGRNITTLKAGDMVGIPWLGYTCGACRYCLRQQENLCENALFTGYTIDGGYAEYTVAYEQYCFQMGSQYACPAGAPLLCAGLIGYRSYTMIGPHVTRLGIYGFGAAAHIIIQVARHQHIEVYAFTRDGDRRAQEFALAQGAVWAGGASDVPPALLDAAIIFAPAGELIPLALRSIDKGGVVVCGGIHMSNIPSFPYRLLWEERIIRSVANLSRKDGHDFLDLAPRIPIRTEIQHFPLLQANEALEAFRKGDVSGAAVLVM
ncbi:zinc-dependent alcohol dehydrogenase family protein [Flavitalea sp. BT771]|uniref:zinc-dependent alcohol dehydrogenase family protein n=1 Tax=Flavitalea sp. BT771 TaxID=3063329 RepID=UPI0026E28B77|nr:zinc-dependent alcohol dehydrogenase family protein [Flavitalea sp. BT771]MDO6429513.1 zinc-dependent alcohol dehydrogenase family protein [Flavitalea sp. BT771]MDV6218359.1 zinc-dependent alcohol dehydrogenase family protein [Flavitalea sp. BT771]